jgi:hypothetical protein
MTGSVDVRTLSTARRACRWRMHRCSRWMCHPDCASAVKFVPAPHGEQEVGRAARAWELGQGPERSRIGRGGWRVGTGRAAAKAGAQCCHTFKSYHGVKRCIEEVYH